MLINSTLHGACPAPFYDASFFPLEGGYIPGRLCSVPDSFSDSPLCCLPCPASYWAYSDNFVTLSTVAGWLNVIGLTLQAFLLISYTVLPAAKAQAHYLTICLTISVVFINLAFVIPLAAKPDQCYDGITPNDMYTSLTCAWSGAFLVAGALAGSFWIFIRAFSMHLIVVWDIVPGRRFFYLSQAIGWGVPAALFTSAISIAGVSFRFGDACHINHDDSMVTFWGWLLAIAGSAVIVQLSTFVYCVRVYFNSIWPNSAKLGTQRSADSLPTSTRSVKSQRARTIYRRLKSVLYLQWRGILIVTIVLVDVIFFAVVFVYLDKLEASVLTDKQRVLPWALCLIESGGDRTACLKYSQAWLISEPTIGAMLIMISLIGIELFALLFRWSLLTGWRDRWSPGNQHDFVSFDARKDPALNPKTPTFELRKLDGRLKMDYADRKSIDSSDFTDPENTRLDSYANALSDAASEDPVPVYSPKRRPEDDTSPHTSHGRLREGASSPPTRNFSSPKMKMEDTMAWNPSSTFARSEARHVAAPSLAPVHYGYRDSTTLPGQAL